MRGPWRRISWRRPACRVAVLPSVRIRGRAPGPAARAGTERPVLDGRAADRRLRGVRRRSRRRDGFGRGNGFLWGDRFDWRIWFDREDRVERIFGRHVGRDRATSRCRTRLPRGGERREGDRGARITRARAMSAVAIAKRAFLAEDCEPVGAPGLNGASRQRDGVPRAGLRSTVDSLLSSEPG